MTTLNNFSKRSSLLNPGPVQVWYSKPECFRNMVMGYNWLRETNNIPDSKNLRKTHIYIGNIGIANVDALFNTLQGDLWSPNGEANGFIKMMGLDHTSMSIGDLFVSPVEPNDFAVAGWTPNVPIMVNNVGWRILP